MKGPTPKTMNEAIDNALNEVIEEVLAKNPMSLIKQREIIKTHIRDFLSQKFSLAYMCDEMTKEELWNKITKDAA